MSIENEPSDSNDLDPRVEVQSEIRRTIDRAVPVGLALAGIAVGASAIRSIEAGWELPTFVHIALVSAGTVAYWLRRRLTFRGYAGSFLALTIIDGAVNMFSYGLAHNGLLVLACASVLAALAFGKRGGFGTLAASAAIWGAAGLWTMTAAHEITPSLELHLFSPWSWVSRVTVGVLFVGVAVAATCATQQRLLRSLQSETDRRREIERGNAALSKAIAERERAQQELAEREDKLRLLTENMEDMIFVQDMNLEVVYVSPSVQRLFGYAPEELGSLSMKDVMTPEAFDRATNMFMEYVHLAQQNPGVDVEVPLMEYEYVRKDGSTFWGELRVGFLRDTEGKLKGSQGILRDVTDRRAAAEERSRLEAELRQADKMRAIGALAGGIAHDFNNQLTGITMGIGLIERAIPDRADVLRYVEFVQTCAKRSSDLTLKLLAFARSSPTVAKPTDIHHVLGEVVSILEHSVDKSIVVTTALEAQRRVVQADTALLQSALLNIAVNARDAMADGGEIEFRTRVHQVGEPRTTTAGLELTPGDYVTVDVRDTGKGMDEAMTARIFEPFFTTKPRGQGTGLGLSTAFGTIKGMGGGIDVDSTVGVGTTFQLWLPLLPEGNAARYDEEPASRRGSGRILLVEDEETVRVATSAMLEALGYDVESCGDGAAAVWMHRRGRYDAVVLDVVLPKVGGKEVFKTIRSQCPDSCILVVSGYAPDGEIGELLDHARVAFVQKPFTAGQLSEALGGLLRT